MDIKAVIEAGKLTDVELQRLLVTAPVLKSYLGAADISQRAAHTKAVKYLLWAVADWLDENETSPEATSPFYFRLMVESLGIPKPVDIT